MSITVGAVASTLDSSAWVELGILKGVVNNEVTIGLKIRILGLDTGGVVRLEELTLDVGLFVPGAHVSSAIKVGDFCGCVTLSVGVCDIFNVEVHHADVRLSKNYN